MKIDGGEMMYKIGFIGCGNMGGAMLKKMLKSGLFMANEVIIADKSKEIRSVWENEWGIATTDDNRKAINAEIIYLAVKPQFLNDVAEEIAVLLPKDALIVSIVMSYDLSRLGQILQNPTAHIVRVMPNTPALVGEGVLAACRNDFVTQKQWQVALDMFSCMGLAREVPENLMEAVTGVSGCGPAFACLFIEALADGAVQFGLPRAKAYEFAAQAVAGAAKMVLETGAHPGVLKDQVCSPGGTTIAGVAALEEAGFRSAVMKACAACIEKSEKLG